MRPSTAPGCWRLATWFDIEALDAEAFHAARFVPMRHAEAVELGCSPPTRPDAWSRSARSSHANPTYPRVLPSSGSPPATGQSSPRDAYEPDVRRADAERARRRPLPTIADASRPTDPGSQLVASTVASMIVGLDPSRLTTTPPPVSQRPPQRAHSSRIAAAASCEIRSGRLPAVK